MESPALKGLLLWYRNFMLAKKKKKVPGNFLKCKDFFENKINLKLEK